ncbi:MAG: hypothetical protein JSV00_03670, partial [bacterium]
MSSAIVALLRPLARVLLRNGIPHRTFAELAKRAYVSAAMEDFVIHGRKPSISRVSVITGLTRKEVSRLRDHADADERISAEKYNRAARVIGGWVRDERFHEGGGQPSDLPVDGEERSFAQLVRLHSGDIPHRAVLDELERVGTVVRLEDGRVRLLGRAYIPRSGEEEKMGILGRDVADLISTIDHNLSEGAGKPHFQRKVSYDNLP